MATGRNERSLTGIGPVSVRRPKVRDRGSVGGERIRFTSAILPRFARRTRSLDAVLPTLYLRGVSSGDFQEALEALLGKDASGLSAQAIGRLKAEWEAEHERWRRRDLSARRYVYMWADGIYLQGRLGGREAMHSGPHRRHAGRTQGTRGLPGGGARERPELA